MLDTEIIGKFKEFQKTETGRKYNDLDINDVQFEKKALKYIAEFPAMTRISGGIDKTILEYNALSADKQKMYKPLISGTVENNQISGYIHINRLSENSLSKPKVISWTRINSEVFFIQENPVCTNDDSFIMEVHKTFIIKYIQYASMVMMKFQQFHWGNKAGKNKVKEVKVPIPKDLDKIYTSFKIQEAIVAFLEDSFEKNKRIKENIDNRYALFERLDKALIPSTFIKDYVKVAFGRYAKENNIDFSIADVQFEIKRIHSDKKDEIICEKRMGFTPNVDINGDINWFSVGDLGDNKGLYINQPNTSKKTTMNLIKEKVDKHNTGKSEKLIPIKKGDILVSFKLTIGVVKIYNSEEPAYCNEAIDILTLNDDVDNKYVAYNCILEYPKNGNKTNNGITLNDDDKKKINIYIPKALNNYTSLEIQKIIADFMEFTKNRLQKEFDRMDECYDALDRLHKAYLARTFTLIDWEIK